jgi:hypothetical protein
MMRKFTLLFLLFIGIQYAVKAQSVTIYLPPGQDTTCFGEQLKFYAVVTAPGATGITFRWFHNSVLSGVTPDTFYTTAPVEGDNVYCIIDYTTSSGAPASLMSNTIIVHRAVNLNPRVLISLIFGSNPDCPGNPLTFKATPIHGGLAPTYQWLINNAPVPFATADTFTHIYGSADTISVAMTSTSECRNFDVAYSDRVPILHTFLTASINISATNNPVCEGKMDTFTATVAAAGSGSTIEWFVDTLLIPGAVGPVYMTDSLYNAAHVYAILHTPDACVINDTTVSNVIEMVVVPNLNPIVTMVLTHGANPGCLDSPLTYTAVYTNFGTTPPGNYWYVNGVKVDSFTTTFTHVYDDGDLLSHQAFTTDGNCYTHDSVLTPAILMVRDTTPATPLVSLISNMLVANAAGMYEWYFNGTLIPGASGQSYHPTMLGHYTCRRIDGYCPSAISNDIFISLLQIDDMSASNIKLYPNPTNGLLHFDFGNVADLKLDVYNVLGQTISHRDIRSRSNHDLDLSTQAPGHYLVVLTDAAGTVSTHKILLTK